MFFVEPIKIKKALKLIHRPENVHQNNPEAFKLPEQNSITRIDNSSHTHLYRFT